MESTNILPRQIILGHPCFIAQPVVEQAGAALDSDTLEATWLRIEEIELLTDELHSPAVLQVLQDYLNGIHYPLALISTC